MNFPDQASGAAKKFPAPLHKVLLLLLCVCATWAAWAQAQKPDLQGSYAIDPAASDDIQSAIDKGTADMGFLIRSAARSRTLQTNPRYQHIRLSRKSTAVSVQFDERSPIEIPLDGRSVAWTRDDGGQDQITAQWGATQLVMHLKSESGERINTFVLQPDGVTLKLDVKLVSPYFSAPISYVLSYRRQAG